MKPRRAYIPIRTDFTPFVSVALLLIVFFICAKVVQLPDVISVWGLQANRKDVKPERKDWTLEILVINKDTIQFCHFPGRSVCRSNFVTAPSHSTKLREALYRYGKEALMPEKLAIVIRLNAESTFGNFADVLNELRVAGNLLYHIIYYRH